MGVTTTKTNKPLNPRGNDQSPLAYNRAKLYSGKALDFDGVNDDINEQTISVSSTSFSVSFYAKADNYASPLCAVSIGTSGTFDLVFYPYDDFIGNGLRIYDAQISSNLLYGVTAELGVYNLFTFQCDGEYLEVYINGQFAKKEARTYSSTYTAIKIGSILGGTQYYNGQMAGFKIFNTALTAAQVADLYNNPEKVVPTGVDNTALKLWLPMMEGAGTTAYDGSGNGNHGTISGATYVNGVGAPVAQSAVIDWNKGGNIVVYSEKLDEWTAQTLTISQSAATAPDGSTNAYDLNDTNSGAYGILLPSSNLAMAGDFVGSVFIKKTTGSLSHYPGLDIGQVGSYLIIDTTNGTAVDTGSNYSDITITSYNDDWWRVSAKATINATKRPIRFWPALSDNGTSISVSATGINTFWGAQVEQADAIGPYVYTGATAQPTPVLLPQGLTTGRDITGVNLFENVRKQGALNLDGNSWAEVHDNASLEIPNTDDVTMEIWFNRLDTPAQDYSKWIDAGEGTLNDTNYSMGSISTIDEVFVEWRTSSSGWIYTDTDVTFNKNEWTHLVVTIEMTGANSSIKTYKNGVLSSTKSQTTTRGTGGKTTIGRTRWNTARTMPDQIAQPRIYNRALTASEVLRNYNSGKNTYK